MWLLLAKKEFLIKLRLGKFAQKKFDINRGGKFLGKTIVEKILAKADLLGRETVSPGDYVEVRHGGLKLNLDCDLEASRVLVWKELGWPELYSPESIMLVGGHVGTSSCPPHSTALTTEILNANREWALKLGVPEENILDLGRAGVEHHVSIDNAWALPGTVHLSIVNGHAYMHGAVGAWAMSLSGAANAFLITGKVWFKVPESAKLIIGGTLQDGVVPRDVIEMCIAEIGEAGLREMVAEFTGPTIDAMSMDGRFTVANGTPWLGAMVGICNPDHKTIAYVKERQPQAVFTPLKSDLDAVYAKILNFDVTDLEPQVACHPDRYDIRPISQVKGMVINRGFIGTCASARMEHLRIAARILKGKKIARSVQLTICPGSVEIYKQAVREGLIEIFLDAECAIAQPACGMCNGAYTPLAAGDICISTSTANGIGRMGSSKSEIYLGSEATVAASCVTGKLEDAREFL